MKRIVIYDSGVGGLSILAAVKEQVPQADYIFLSDNAGFPYGTKPESELLDRVMAVSRAVIDHFDPDLVIVACNTASTLALSTLRDNFSTPFVGVVPAIKPAALISQTKSIAVMATPATVSRQYTQDLIDQYAKDCSVSLVAAPELVELAETKLRGESVDLSVLANSLKPIIDNQQIDVLVLACTHFPLLRSEITHCLTQANRSVAIIDSGEAIARRAAHVLATSGYQSTNQQIKGQAEHIALFTKRPQLSDVFLAYLEKLDFAQIQELSV